MNAGFDRIASLADGKPVAIFGAGISGKSVEKLLEKIGLKGEIYAQDSGNLFGESAAKRHSLAVYSPAFRPDNPWLETARKGGCTCLCEPDFACLAHSGKIIAITGTNGKTTTTKFLTKALNDAGIKAVAAGNVGTPLSQICAEGGSSATAVCELSSFQTMSLEYLSPEALLWTNFDADHLDWHKDMREYFCAKVNLVRRLKGEAFVAGSSVGWWAQKFSIPPPEFTVFFDEDKSYEAPEPFTSAMQSRNFHAVRLLWEKLGLDDRLLAKSAADFRLPQFRFACAQTVGGVNFYNDSKATNAHAAIAALREFPADKSLVWLGGGKDKHCGLEELACEVEKHCKNAVLIGQTAQELQKMLRAKGVECHIEPDMQKAVKKCFEVAKKGDSVLFSPGFSSFGMFSGYAERGKSFDEAVLCLKNLKKDEILKA